SDILTSEDIEEESYEENCEEERDWVLRSITNGDKDEFGMGGRKKGKPSMAQNS
ncbi:11374_t:CDS:2, partial [Entrophospora sp. SA101]